MKVFECVGGCAAFLAFFARADRVWVGGNTHHAGSSLRPAGLVEIVPILNELAEFLGLADFFT